MPYAAGTCRGCGEAPLPGKSRCEACARAKRELERELREHRREHGLCLTCGAPVARTKALNAGRKRVREPARYCGKHLAYYAERQRVS